MTKIEEKLNDAISQGLSTEYLTDSLKRILERHGKSYERMYQSTAFLVFFVVVFELLIRASIAEINMGPFKLKDISVVQKFIPVIVAYFYISMMSLILATSYLGLASLVLTKHLYRPVYDTEIIKLEWLPASVFTIRSAASVFSKSPPVKILEQLENLVIAVLLGGPLVFEVYAYYQCFRLFGLKSVAVWISAVSSAILLLYGVLLFFSIDGDD